MPEALRHLERLIDVNGGCLPPPKNIINSIGIRMVETEEYIALGT